MRDETILAGLAITGLTVLESTALLCGFDGQAFSLIVAGIAGIAGYALNPVVKNLRSPETEKK